MAAGRLHTVCNSWKTCSGDENCLNFIFNHKWCKIEIVKGFLCSLKCCPLQQYKMVSVWVDLQGFCTFLRLYYQVELLKYRKNFKKEEGDFEKGNATDSRSLWLHYITGSAGFFADQYSVFRVFHSELPLDFFLRSYWFRRSIFPITSQKVSPTGSAPFGFFLI